MFLKEKYFTRPRFLEVRFAQVVFFVFQTPLNQVKPNNWLCDETVKHESSFVRKFDLNHTRMSEVSTSSHLAEIGLLVNS